MKKHISLFLIALFLTILLAGCASFSETDSANSNYQSYSFNNNKNTDNEQTYTGTVSSSKYLSTKLYKGDKVFVFGNFTYEYNRQFELELKSKLEEIGLTAYISTDYPNVEEAIRALVDFDCKCWMLISPEDISTYEYGGGVASFKASANVFQTDVSVDTPLIEMYATVLCEHNEMESFEKTIRIVLNELSSDLTKELSEYIEIP